MSADQLRAAPDQFAGTVVGKIEKQVSTYRITDTNCNSTQKSGADQKNGYCSVCRHIMAGCKRRKQNIRHHAQKLKSSYECADRHSGVGVVAKCIEQIADFGLLPELQFEKDTGQSDPQHIGTCIDHKKDDEGEQERDEQRFCVEAGDHLRQKHCGECVKKYRSYCGGEIPQKGFPRIGFQISISFERRHINLIYMDHKLPRALF